MQTARFIQIHYLTAYAANNLNRDDQSRPKSLIFGNASRMRISSQCAKRAWRLSELFKEGFGSEIGTRTRNLFLDIGAELLDKGHSDRSVVAHLMPFVEAFGLGKKADSETASADVAVTPSSEQAAAETESSTTPASGKKNSKPPKPKPEPLVSDGQTDLFYFSQSEIDFIYQNVEESLNEKGCTGGEPWAVSELSKKLSSLVTSWDVAMFGRMVAKNNGLTVEGAIQVAHLFTVNKAVPDDDFFTAVDDLPSANGSGHLGVVEFGSGLYYGYVNIDVPLLIKNLNNDVAKAHKLINTLIEVIATVSPGGKQNTLSARSCATYLMVETGKAQPRSFADAFLTPIKAEPLAAATIDAINASRNSLIFAFPSQKTNAVEVNRISGKGTINDIFTLIAQTFPTAE